ncbi:MAG: ATP-binding cassette domain-containing protein [Lachnospiraceae bacterium]|nr:ATP-binding cassette domain-containing protein [Lachnospiraceae bacterium]
MKKNMKNTVKAMENNAGSDLILETRNLTKQYGNKKVVNAANMHIHRGDIYGFIGKNGAGKTTLMKMVCGLIAPTSGSFTLMGCSNPDEGRKKIGSIIENPALFPNMTVKENMRYYGKLKHASAEKIEDLLKLAGLNESAFNKKAANLSLGMKQRVSIAIALLNDPEFLILDEPINGLDPEGIVEIRKLLVRLNQERGITILISSHILGELEKMVTRYGIIQDGQLVREFAAEELQNQSSGKIVLEADDFDKACRILAENGINITRSFEQKEDLEDMFIHLMAS